MFEVKVDLILFVSDLLVLLLSELLLERVPHDHLLLVACLFLLPDLLLVHFSLVPRDLDPLILGQNRRTVNQLCHLRLGDLL